jgi:prepilin-type N-terminal cleavage/methylation domain-containing protein/prepilin-type processing-associated H-X9-DG protein
MRKTRRPRNGFTLVELMVVVGIISVLIALLLPAVQSAREGARRAQCINNLVQIGVALRNYESTHNVYPPGVVNPAGPVVSLPKGYHHGWITQILPFLQQGNAFRKVDFGVGVYDAQNSTLRGVAISSLMCPSDPGPGRGMSWGAGYPGSLNLVPAQSSYAACHHDVEAPIDAGNHGVFYLNSRIRDDDVTDGLSTTIFVGEMQSKPATLGWMSGTRATLRNTGSPINKPRPELGVLLPVNAEASTDDAEATERESESVAGGMVSARELAAAARIVGGYSSYHSGGANFLFGDGSVRFITDRADPNLFRHLGHRADGELVSSDGF